MSAVAVLGASGCVGRQLVDRLVEEGHTVTAVARKSHSDSRPQVTVLPGDVCRWLPGQWARLLDGHAVVYLLIHALDQVAFPEVEQGLATNLAAAAATSGTRVVYLGGLGRPTGSAHLRSRHAVGRILANGCETVTLEAALLIGTGSAGFDAAWTVANCWPRSCPAPAPSTRLQPLALSDAVAYLVGAGRLPAGTWQIGGPSVVSYGQLLEACADIAGRQLRVVNVPARLAPFAAPALARASGQAPRVLRALLASVACDAVVTNPGIHRHLPLTCRTLHQAIAQAAAQGNGSSASCMTTHRRESTR